MLYILKAGGLNQFLAFNFHLTLFAAPLIMYVSFTYTINKWKTGNMTVLCVK